VRYWNRGIDWSFHVTSDNYAHDPQNKEDDPEGQDGEDSVTCGATKIHLSVDAVRTRGIEKGNHDDDAGNKQKDADREVTCPHCRADSSRGLGAIGEERGPLVSPGPEMVSYLLRPVEGRTRGWFASRAASSAKDSSTQFGQNP
jgi:hypothetical protein